MQCNLFRRRNNAVHNCGRILIEVPRTIPFKIKLIKKKHNKKLNKGGKIQISFLIFTPKVEARNAEIGFSVFADGRSQGSMFYYVQNVKKHSLNDSLSPYTRTWSQVKTLPCAPAYNHKIGNAAYFGVSKAARFTKSHNKKK